MILKQCGYNNFANVADLNSETITEIEQYFNDNSKYVLKSLECSHSETYNKQEVFKFLPGHRKLIPNFPKYVQSIKATKVSFHQSQPNNMTEFSYLLKLLIETAEHNSNKVPTQYRYHEMIRHFAIYIYIMAGRACYETLSRNLPLPQASTICK